MEDEKFDNNYAKAKKSVRWLWWMLGMTCQTQIALILFYPVVYSNNDLQSPYVLLQLAYIAVLFATAYAYLRWLNGIYWNLHMVEGYEPKFSKGGNDLIWIVPVLNIIVPMIMLLEINRFHQDEDTPDTRVRMAVYVWALSFAIWYIAHALLFHITPMFPEDQMIQYSLGDFLLEQIIFLSQVVGLLCMIFFVIKVTDMENENMDTGETNKMDYFQ